MIDSLFYPMLGNTVLVSAVIVLLTLFGRMIKKRYMPKWRYVVGIMLAVRLLVPIQISVPANIAPPVQLPAGERVDAVTQTTDRVGEPVPLPNTAKSVNEKWTFAVVLYYAQILWIAGVFGFLLASGVRYGLAKYWLRRWRVPADEELDTAVDDLRKELGLHKKVRVYMSRQVDSPMLVGLLWPAVYLPKGILLPEEIRLVLRHELTHCKRGDLWCKFLMLLANAVHWFNPFIYLLRRRMDNDIEMICDEEAMKGLEDSQRYIYAEAMLAVMKQKLNPGLRVGARFLGRPRSMRERFENILHFKIKKRGVLMEFVIGLLLLCGSIGYTAPDAASVGIIGGADGPTAIYLTDEIVWDNAGLQALYAAVLEQNKASYVDGECQTAAVYVLKEEHTDREDIYYCLTQYGGFGFENGYFTKVSGTGAIPVRMRFDKNMNLIEYKAPMDGKYYADSIREMFPADIQGEVVMPGEDLCEKLVSQEIEQAKTYLAAIGRQAEVVYNWRREKGNRLADMDVGISNFLMDSFNEYPYWIGTIERIENGVRYVYEKSWDEESKGTGTVAFTKYRYDTKQVVFKQAYIVRGDALIPLAEKQG